MEAKVFKVSRALDRSLYSDAPGPAEHWSYYIREESMSAAEQEVAQRSKLRTKASGYSNREDALAAAKLDAKDIRRAVRAEAVKV